MKKLIGFVLILVLTASAAPAKEFKITSPDKKLEIRVNVSDAVTYSVYKNGNEILLPSRVSLSLYDGKQLGINPVLLGSKTVAVNKILRPVVKQKFASVADNYAELRLDFKGDYSLLFRVYNDGAAYRFCTSIPGEIIIKSEQTEYNFAKDFKILFPEENSFMSHSERLYKDLKLSDVNPERFCSLPALIYLDNGMKAAITEVDLEDYCGMYLTGNKDNRESLVGMFPAYPARDTARNDRDIYVVERKDFIAKTSGSRAFPWRVMMVSEKDGDLIESTIVYRLAKASDPAIDFSWVRPGKVAWDWWNFNNIYKVDFRAGINNDTYKYYIDFASKYGIEYVILDEGWYKLGNLLDVNPDINVQELVDYGKERNVGIVLWCIWKTLDDQLQPALDQFEKWGVKGIKVDFMQRDDQPVVDYYYRISREAAKRKMLVDFHGAYKPTGLYRTFPNVITSEGVLGMEHDKWSEDASPQMTTTLPFIRMLAGPMDYTPGAMLNATKQAFKPIFTNPMSQGTRCQQLALYINFESPLQMLADNPTHYYTETECMEFLSRVPVQWDDTKVLDASVGEYILTARRNGDAWYVGAITNWTPRDLSIDFSFLPAGRYNIEIWQDGINADRNAQDYKKVSQQIDNNTKLDIHLAPGGGWVGIITK